MIVLLIKIFPVANGPPFTRAGDVRAEGAASLRLQLYSFHHLSLNRYLMEFCALLMEVRAGTRYRFAGSPALAPRNKPVFAFTLFFLYWMLRLVPTPNANADANGS